MGSSNRGLANSFSTSRETTHLARSDIYQPYPRDPPPLPSSRRPRSSRRRRPVHRSPPPPRLRMDAQTCEVLYQPKNARSRLGGVLGTKEGVVGAIVYQMPEDAVFDGNLKAGVAPGQLAQVEAQEVEKPSKEEDNKPV